MFQIDIVNARGGTVNPALDGMRTAYERRSNGARTDAAAGAVGSQAARRNNRCFTWNTKCTPGAHRYRSRFGTTDARADFRVSHPNNVAGARSEKIGKRSFGNGKRPYRVDDPTKD